MGCVCCKRRLAGVGHDVPDSEFIPPSTAWARRQRGVATTSMDSEKLVALADDTSKPHWVLRALQSRGVFLGLPRATRGAMSSRCYAHPRGDARCCIARADALMGAAAQRWAWSAMSPRQQIWQECGDGLTTKSRMTWRQSR